MLTNHWHEDSGTEWCTVIRDVAYVVAFSNPQTSKYYYHRVRATYCAENFFFAVSPCVAQFFLALIEEIDRTLVFTKLDTAQLFV